MSSISPHAAISTAKTALKASHRGRLLLLLAIVLVGGVGLNYSPFSVGLSDWIQFSVKRISTNSTKKDLNYGIIEILCLREQPNS